MELYKMNSKGSSLDFSRQLEGGNDDSKQGQNEGKVELVEEKVEN